MNRTTMEAIRLKARDNRERERIADERARIRSMTPHELDREFNSRVRRNMNVGMERKRAELAALSELRCLGAGL